jgi:hypothetical protein
MNKELTALDSIAVVLTATEAAVLFAFPWTWGQSFQRLFAEFGVGVASLPLLTRLVLTAWFPLLLGALTTAGTMIGSIPIVPLSLSTRRWALVGTFAFGGAALGLCLVGLYVPMFSLAERIPSE